MDPSCSMPRLRLSLKRISIAMANWHKLGQVSFCRVRCDLKNMASEGASKEYPTQSVIARVLARVAEWNTKLLHRFCRGKLHILEGQQMLLPQIRQRAMSQSELTGCKLRGLDLQLQGTTMRGSGYRPDWSRLDDLHRVLPKQLQYVEVISNTKVMEHFQNCQTWQAQL